MVALAPRPTLLADKAGYLVYGFENHRNLRELLGLPAAVS
jgi:hypothetical protein